MTEKDPKLPAMDAEQIDYDRRDAKSGLIAAASVGTLVLLVVMIAGVWWLYNVWYDKVEHEQYTGVASQELRAIHHREEQQLHRYAYIDKATGVVRLPIDRAIEIIAAEYKEGKVAYNTKSYPVKQEPPGGAAGGGVVVPGGVTSGAVVVPGGVAAPQSPAASTPAAASKK